MKHSDKILSYTVSKLVHFSVCWV